MSANSVCDKEVISYTQGAELISALVRAGLTRSIAQEVIGSRGNRKAQAMLAALLGGHLIDEHFEIISSFDIVVPEGYDHATRLDTFRREHELEFRHFNSAITDANYAAPATSKLVPDQKLKCKVVRIKESVSSDDCLDFLKSQKARLIGAQGISLAYEQGKNKLPKGRFYASFDEKDALWKDSDGNHRVPGVRAYSDGDFGFFLGGFEVDWGVGDGLLCFCDA
jgi:hypothetical protein